MKKFFFLLSIIIFYTGKIFAQSCNYDLDTTTININCGDSVRLFSSFCKIDTLSCPTNNCLYSVCFTNPNTGYAVGRYGSIIKTLNAGNSWSVVPSGVSYTLYSVCFPTSDTGFAVGSGAEFLKTVNAGNSWSIMTCPYNIVLRSVYFVNSNVGYIAGWNGSIYKTTNSGNSWTVLSTGIQANIYKIYFTDPNTGYAVADSGRIIKTIDAGNNWTSLQTGTTASLISIFFSNASTGYAVGTNSTILKTTDAGATWHQVASGISDDPVSICFANANDGVAVTWGGKIIKTTDAGNTWHALNSSAFLNLMSVVYTNSNAYYAVGGYSFMPEIIKITNMNNATFSWQPNIGLSNNLVAEPIARPISSMTYKVTITPNSGLGCNVQSDSLKISVNQLSINATGGSIFCKDSAQLTSNMNFVNGIYNYSWTPTNGLSNPNIENPKASPSVNTQYTITVNPNNGCANAHTNANVNINPLWPIDLCMVSIRNDKNLIIWEKPLVNNIDSFYIWRETSITDIYEKIGGTSYNDSSIFVDFNSNPLIQSNKYKISIKDLCNIESDKSFQGHKTMHLAINSGIGTTWNLIWEPYEGFTVSTYKIYRGTTPTNLTMIGTTSGSSTQYTDYTAPAGIIYYQVQVVSPSPCNPSKSYNNSMSNIATNDPYYGITKNICEKYNAKIYPNPAYDKIFIESPALTGNTTASIYSIQGQLLYEQKLLNTKTEIDIRGFAKGVYYVKFQNADGSGVKKFVKE